MAASEAPIKSLEVQVEAQANSATIALEKLAVHLEKVGSSLDGIGNETKEVGKIGSSMGKATKQINAAATAADNFSKKLRRGDGGLTRAGMDAKNASGQFRKAADALGDVSKAAAKPLSTDMKERAKQFAQMLQEEDPSLTEKRAALLGKVMAGYKSASGHIDEVKKRHEEAAVAAEKQADAERETARATQEISTAKPTAEIERASSAWTTFLDSAKELAPVMKKAMSIVGRLGRSVASGAAKMAKAIINPIKAVKQLGNGLRDLLGIEKRSGGLLRGRSLGQFIGLIAFRRAITAAIRALTSGIKEGSDNLTHYSAEYNNSISSMVSSLNYLKNAWAAAFAPIVNVVAPYISAFIDMLASALNAIGRFMAVLTGKGFAVQAVKGWTDVAAAANSAAGGAGKAAKAAEEYKRTIMSFDELHVLNAPDDGSGSGGSGGGGGGGNGTDYSSMFTTVAVDTEEGLAAALRKAFDAGDFEEIGRLLAEAIADSLDRLDWEDIETKASDVASKLASTINGFIGDDHLWSSLGETIGGMINAASGTVATFFDEVKFKELGEQIGEMVNKAVGKWKPSKTGKAIAGIINSGITSSYGFLSTTDFSSLGTKVGKMTIDAVNGIQWDTLGSSAALFGVGLFNFLNNFLKTPGLFTALGTNIKNGIKSWFSTMTSKGAWEVIGNTIRNALKALIEFVAGILPTREEWNEFAANLETAVADAIRGLTADPEEIVTAFGELLGKVFELVFALPKLKIAIAKGIAKAFGGEEAAEAIESVFGVNKELGSTGNPLDFDVGVTFTGKVEKSLTDGKKILDSVKSKVVTATGKGKQDSTFTFFTDKNKNWRKYAADKIVTALAIGNPAQTFIELYREYTSLVNKRITVTAEAMANQVRMFFNIIGNAHGGILMANGWQPVQGYASGGLVTAEHFIARENGMPELVGRIGTHTAVMNNDQIVASVSNGVYQAVVSAMANSGGNNSTIPYQLNVTVKTQNDEVLARAVQRGNASRNYRANAFA